MGHVVPARLCMGFDGVQVHHHYKALLAAVVRYGLLVVQDNLQVVAADSCYKPVVPDCKQEVY